jgi:3-deoxy-7-phosphoheptulonate synthase
MIIVLKPGTSEEGADSVRDKIESRGLNTIQHEGVERTVINVIGDERELEELHLENHPQVEKVLPILSRYKLVSREFRDSDSTVEVGGVPVGGGRFTVIAGPCSIESLDQMQETAEAVRDAGAAILRGGAYKPRTSPYSFQGLGVEGLDILQKVMGNVGMPAFTEVMEIAHVDYVEKHGGAFQIGARNMQNTGVLKAVGQRKTPVLLKRGMAATVEQLLLAAEYIVSEGNPNVILCERGITTFETSTRNTLDLNCIPVLKEKTHLPVVIDPSHGTGVRGYVKSMALAAAAAGADGVIVEVHRNPAEALSDGMQSLYPEQFADLMKSIEPVVHAVGKELVPPDK